MTFDPHFVAHSKHLPVFTNSKSLISGIDLLLEIFFNFQKIAAHIAPSTLLYFEVIKSFSFLIKFSSNSFNLNSSNKSLFSDAHHSKRNFHTNCFHLHICEK